MKKRLPEPVVFPTEFSMTAAGVRFNRNSFGKPSFRVKGVMTDSLKAEAVAEVARRTDLFCKLISADQHVAGDVRGWAKWRLVTDREPAQYGECCHCGEILCFVTLFKGSERATPATHRSGPCFLCEAALEKATKIACVVPAAKADLREAFRQAQSLGPIPNQWMRAPWE